jgi:4-diphosphocytidyl-2-C-methyl-D-erythritol kinase
VAFFISGGTALMEGRGELVTLLPSLSEAWVVLVVPPVSREPGKTGRAYAGLNQSDYTDGQYTGRLVQALKGGGTLEPAMMFNVFERTVYSRNPEMSEYRQRMMTAGADNVHLAGSGPTLFALVHDKATAEQLYSRLLQKGIETYLARTARLNRPDILS